MKTNLFLFLFLFFSKLQSQVVFCPPGAEWHYSFYIWSPASSIANETIKYGRDSVSGNETFKLLYHKRFFRTNNIVNVGQSHIKQKGDTVFVRSQCTANNWQVLYNFAALPGQKWNTTVYPYASPSSTTYAITYTITVDSVGSVNINNFNLKRLYVKYQSWAHTTPAIITERLGCETFMFNYRNTFVSDGDMVVGSLCYQDSVFGLKQYTEKPCDYIDAASIGEGDYGNTQIKIYSNPAIDFFTIRAENESTTGECTVSIKDLCGREIRQVVLNNLNSERVTVDVADLANGVYILSISNKGKIIFNDKVVKSE